MNYTYDAFIAAINRSPLLAGICMLVLNVGSRYIDLGLSKSQENLIAKSLAREVLIFAICFMGTKDVALSIVLTGSFIVLSDHVLNESSPYCPCLAISGASCLPVTWTETVVYRKPSSSGR